MITHLYSIHDSKAQAYNSPFAFHRDEQAMRTFSDCIRSPEHTFSKNPADYTLFKIGTYDDEQGDIQPNVPYSLGNGVEFLTDTPTGIHPNEIAENESLQQHSKS